MATRILALGDSWFHYPNALSRDGVPVSAGNGVGNILHHLVGQLNFPVDFREKETSEIFDALSKEIIEPFDDAFGKNGEELLLMVYGYTRMNPGVPVYRITWLDMVVDRIESYKHDYDTFILLLSGGGNDIVDKNLPSFLNPIGSADPVNQTAINNAINTDLRGAYAVLMARICNQFPDKTFHFITHGYACPPVDGRSLFDADKNFLDRWLHKRTPGPWLKPSFDLFKIPRPLSDSIIDDFINRFNTMMSQLICVSINNNGTLHYLDLRGVPDKANLEASWCNELHLDRPYFVKAAAIFNTAIKSVMKIA
jgi:hypothetical protein